MHTWERSKLLCHCLKNLSTYSPHSLPSAQEDNGEALPPSVQVLHSRRSFRRSKQALPSKKQPVGPWRKWQPYLHAIFHLIIPNLDMAQCHYATIRQGAVSHLFVLISCDMTSCGCLRWKKNVRATQSALTVAWRHMAHICVEMTMVKKGCQNIPVGWDFRHCRSHESIFGM